MGWRRRATASEAERDMPKRSTIGTQPKTVRDAARYTYGGTDGTHPDGMATRHAGTMRRSPRRSDGPWQSLLRPAPHCHVVLRHNVLYGVATWRTVAGTASQHAVVARGGTCSASSAMRRSVCACSRARRSSSARRFQRDSRSSDESGSCSSTSVTRWRRLLTLRTRIPQWAGPEWERDKRERDKRERPLRAD